MLLIIMMIIASNELKEINPIIKHPSNQTTHNDDKIKNAIMIILN
jgi:hypothetical protein